MVSEGTDYVDVIIVGVLWGCTNPFLRKGTYEEDEKLRIQREELQKEHEYQIQQQQDEEAKRGRLEEENGYRQDGEYGQAAMMESVLREEQIQIQVEYGTTDSFVSNVHNNNIPVDSKSKNMDHMKNETGYSKLPSSSDSSSKNTTSSASESADVYDLYQEHTIEKINKRVASDVNNITNQFHPQEERIPTSHTKGVFLQCLDKYCCCFCNNDPSSSFKNSTTDEAHSSSSSSPNNRTKFLTILARFHPKYLLQGFLSSLIYELSKFTKPKIAIPFFFNQCSAFFYYRLIATSALTNVPYCQATGMAIEGVVSYLLGERMINPVRGFGGAIIVTTGVCICILSEDIHDYLFGKDDNGGIGQNYYNQVNNERMLTMDGEDDDNGHEMIISHLWQSRHSESTSLFEISPFVGWYAFCGVLHWFLGLFTIRL